MTHVRMKAAGYALSVVIAALAASVAIASTADVAAAATLKFTSASPQLFWYGKSAILRGKLTTEAVVGQPRIEIQTQSKDGIWSATSTVTANASGAFAVSVAPTRTAAFRAVSVDDPNVVSSAVSVIPRVDLQKITGPSANNRKVAWIGRSAAVVCARSLPSGLVMVGYRLERGKWRRRATWKHPTIFAVGIYPGEEKVRKFSFTLMLKFPKRGTWRIRLESKRTATYGSSVGPYKRIRVR